MAKILIVDDRPFNRQFLMTVLANTGHALREAGDGKAALDAIYQERPDLVITDVLMPVMDGFELARSIRKDETLAQIPIIFYTSTFRAPQARALAEASGVNVVLNKPSSADKVIEAINGLLGLESKRGAAEAAAILDTRHQVEGADPRAVRQQSTMQRQNAQLTSLIEATFEVRPQQGPQHVADMFFDIARKIFHGTRVVLVLDTSAAGEPIILGAGVEPGLVLSARSSGFLGMKLTGLAGIRTADPETLERLVGPGDSTLLFAAPVTSSEHRYGWIYLGIKDQSSFSPEDERTLLTIAGELAVFYETAEVHDLLQRHAARLQVESAGREKAEKELRNRYREQAALAEFSVASLSSERFNEQIDHAAEIVCGALEVDICVIVSVNVARDVVNILSEVGWQGSTTRSFKFGQIPKTSLMHLVLEKGGYRFSDIDGPLPFVADRRLLALGIKSGLVECSVYGNDDRILVYAYSKTLREFAQTEADLLRTIGNVIAVFKDREQAQERLKVRERALESISQGITITDETGIFPSIIYSNPAFQRMTGLREKELLGRDSKSLLADQNNEMLNGQIALARAKRRTLRFEAKMRGKDGATFIDSVVASPIVDAEGTLTHTVAVHDDITDARRRDEQLHESQKMEAVGQLTGGIAHDFNNLLTVIKANAEDLLQDLKGDEIQGKQAEMLLMAANRGADLVQQLMAFARKQELEPVAVDVNGLLATFGKLLSRTLPENVRLVLKPTPNLPRVLADPGRLEGSLLNLSLNSRDAMPDGGAVTIETSLVTLDRSYAAENPGVVPGTYVQIAVSDEGHGMPKDVIERAFQPFFTTKEVGKGTGLGLSMVYGFVKQSGGHANITSEVGVGTTIKLYLPPAPDAVAEEAKVDAAEPEAPQASGRTILLVEDDDLVRQSVMNKLGRLGFFVTETASAAEAIKTLEAKSEFDLVFTDVIMPGALSGADLAREVMRRWPGIRILMTSGYTEATALGKIKMPENVRLLSKPYANADLKRMIAEVMAAPPPQ
jgi:PAS domain S-box-containing protein